jgi:small-conductance mechanosensitive channel
MIGTVTDVWNKAMGPESPYRTPIITVVTLAAIYVAYKIITMGLKRYLNRKSAKSDNVQRFLFVWRYVWFGIAIVFLLISLSGSLAAMGISAAFLGLILGWSLQAPVTGMAAWLMIILKRPFKIGDRVIIAGIVGDVVDISLTHILLNQVGGTVGGEEKSGRGVMIPNATLFQQIIYNYSFESSYLLDEVAVLITYESDLEEAERLCIEAAAEVTAQIIGTTGKEPFSRAELADSGIRIRVRYQTLATERQRISNDIVHGIVRRFNETKLVEFAYPHTEVLYRPKGPQKRRAGMPESM